MKNSAEQITNCETIENNKLIAEFMGNSFEPLPDTNNECFSLLGSWDVIHITDFETGVYAYHSDWNKLMVIIGKIERLGHRITITTQVDDWCNVLFHNPKFIHVEREKDKKLTVYLACISFIKWYNENK